MQNVRQRILQIIQERGQATVAELAELLDMAPVSVRHHLDILQGDGLIRVDGVRRRPGAGRPQHVYTLTPQALEVFPKNYHHVLHHFLTELKARETGDEVERFIQRVARRMAEDMVVELPPEHTWEERLSAVVAALNAHGYMASWTAREDGWLICLANCPYVGLIDRHPEFCCLDRHVLQALLPSAPPVQLQETIRDGAYRCQLKVPVPASVQV